MPDLNVFAPLQGPLALRAMQWSDLPAVARLQALAYPAAFIEDDATLQRRFLTHAETAWVASASGQLVGYLVAYPSVWGQVTALGGEFAVHTQPNCLYLHDLAVDPAAKGQGLGGRLVRHALQGVSGLTWSALVSVQASGPFWQALGYQTQRLSDAGQHQNLASYPGDAVYMGQRLSR